MSLKIPHGLFKFDFTDQHAILGVPVDADADVVRKQYLKIARRLHPDKFRGGSETEKQTASQLFSKLVNPAYETLYAEKSRTENKIMLGRMGKRLAAEAGKVQIHTDPAKQLAQAGNNIDVAYKSLLHTLATIQYENLNQAVEIIAQISELNMVYLMRKQGEFGIKHAQAKEIIKPASQAEPVPTKEVQPEKTSSVNVEAYCRRAEEYMSKNNFAKAVLELREALQSDVNNSRTHGLLGMAYLSQNQATMAKIHINKALQLNPQEENALKAKQLIEKLGQKGATGNTTKPGTAKDTKGKPDDKSGGTTIFGIRFGGKKK